MPGTWSRPPARAASLLGPRRLLVLNQEIDLEDVGWDAPRLDHLLRYNVHYFDDLNASGAEVRRAWHEALLRSWAAEHLPPGVGWEPYPTSIRMVNWMKWALSGNELPVECVQSLAVQARWLCRRIEWHLLANHLFVNAKALLFAGTFFQGPEADRWRRVGADILAREVPEQILADGGHFERSPMYHGLILEDILDLANLDAAFAGTLDGALSEAIDRVPSMCRWLSALCHPDGEIAFFNDAAFGIAPKPREILDYALRLGFPSTAPAPEGCTVLEPSGFVHLRRGPAVLIADVGPIGPDYMPAHGHADTLSFELSLHGRRVVVNSGTSEYGHGPERCRQRGTAAHSTLSVAGLDSSEVWGGFRVGRRARAFGLQVEDSGAESRVRCCHDGYRWLPGSPIHCRSWTLSPDGLEVRDDLSARIAATMHLHLSPGSRAYREGSIVVDGGVRVAWMLEGALAHVVPSTWHPEFGRVMSNECLTASLAGDRCILRLRWT
jgi:uncharacterized heparinase superfamily protein